MKNKKIVSLICLVLVMSLMFVGCGGNGQQTSGESQGSEEKLIWKFAHSGRNDDMLDSYAKKFKDVIEAKSNGRVEIQLFPAEQLGDDNARLEHAQNGTAEFVIVAAPFIGSVAPEMQVFGLNFVFSEDTSVNAKVLREGKAAEKLETIMLDKNVKIVDWITEDFSCWTSNKPIRNLADIKDQKIRVMESPMDIEGLKVLGANPTPISFTEVYSALQLNMVDGQQNPIVIINSNKFNEVQKYLMLSNHTVVVDILASNPNFYNGLSEADRKLVDEAVAEVNGYITNMQSEMTGEALQAIEDAGTTEIIEFSGEIRNEFKEASKVAMDKYFELAGESGKEIYNLLIEDVKNFDQ
ncbi:extracellular solute-binding protein, family 7 [Dethiosulfatibacter aminovorans DSM 17477]|uniref:Extracellular solute-binding protein, family 7 n=1 Tax=Dethiosulfatibacter aminovorans DSM 17477 TaxID=1121476 RepID=A0A1M6HUX4_9FIRM|nr:DctP family TRAP transporter solute-binding subunit [Dethiosulfatibacter aminovorans]SHJ25927.1 extracellular solute-binding protein, family 7 [Dethiosulfatibacter aminovorans DSM 17477]